MSDPQSLEGTWNCLSAVIDGRPLAEEKARQLQLILTREAYTTKLGNQVLFDGKYTLDPKADPKGIDIIAVEGESQGQTSKGIYALDGETYQLCYGASGRERPQAFESKAGSGVTYAVWKRAQ